MAQTISSGSHVPVITRARSKTLKWPSSLPKTPGTPRLSLSQYTLTPYEVRQLMKAFNSTVERDKTPIGSSAEVETENQLMGRIHDQFCSRPLLRSDLKSGMLNSSEDSGIDESVQSSRLSVNDVSLQATCENGGAEEISGTCTPVIREVHPQLLFGVRNKQLSENDNSLPKPKQRRFFLKKIFRMRNPSDRRRSKSLGAPTLLATGDRPTSVFGSSLLNREWEIVTVREMCRRLSLDEAEQLEMPIPEGASQSQILDELMIRQIMEILPPRAEGYPWMSIYNSEKHGFSLTTLYRKMIEFDEDLSPVLLIIRDTREHVFGAVVSGAIRPSDHYTGTGDSSLLWRFLGEVPHTRELRHYKWTGENQFFVNSAKDSLSIGAGGGHCGLWLDADLNHGRSQRCDTFDNEPLAGEKEDFIVQFIEAFGFRM